MNTKINGYINLLKECKSTYTLKKIFTALCKTYNYHYIIYNIQITHPFENTEYFAIGNYPEEWIEVYMTSNYATIDPIIKYCKDHTKSIFWHDTYNKKSTSEIIDFFEHSKEFGLYDGISKGIKIQKNEIGILSMAKREMLTLAEKSSIDTLQMIDILQPYIHETIIRISKKSFSMNTPSLTSREKEVLFHLAKGGTSIEVSKALNISETTVVFHTKNIIEKVDARNRTHAVAKVIVLNLINFDDYKENNYNW